MTVSSSEEGVWQFTSDGREETCGLYLVTNPDMLIEIEIIDLDVDCETGLLVVEIYKKNFFEKEDNNFLSGSVCKNFSGILSAIYTYYV